MKSKEEILNNMPLPPLSERGKLNVLYTRHEVLLAMEEYAKQVEINLREELINFFAWQNTLDYDETIRVVDNYLKSKPCLR